MRTTAPEPPTASWDGHGVSIAQVLDRLAAQRRTGYGPPLNLAGVLNLVVPVPAGEDVEAMRAVIEGLADHQPSRAVLLVESDAGEGIDAAVSTSCRWSGGAASVCVEMVVLALHGEGRAGDASAIRPLLRSDLPTVLWWPGPPDPSPDGPLARLAPLADRIVTESGRDAAGAEALTRLARWAPGVDAAVTDLAWAAITPWRQLLAQMIDLGEMAHPDAGPVRAIVSHPAAGATAEALLLAGWLSDLAGPRLDLTMNVAPGDAAVLGVDIDLTARERRIAINRMPGRQAATVCVTQPGRDGADRALTLPVSDRSRLLAGELELQRRDTAFERALTSAAEVAAR